MDNDKFGDLLSRLPEIAKAVNEFKSEELQAKAFDALMRAAGVGSGSDVQASDAARPAPNTRSSSARRQAASASPGKQGVTRRGSGQNTLLDLDLHPSGKLSLKEFFAEKLPKNDPERYVCIVYYLKHIAGEPEVTANHLYTAFKALSLKVPNIASGLNNARTRHGWITTSGGQISLTRIGENMVEHDLPGQKEGDG